jgi:hypothetical protein
MRCSGPAPGRKINSADVPRCSCLFEAHLVSAHSGSGCVARGVGPRGARGALQLATAAWTKGLASAPRVSLARRQPRSALSTAMIDAQALPNDDVTATARAPRCEVGRASHHPGGVPAVPRPQGAAAPRHVSARGSGQHRHLPSRRRWTARPSAHPLRAQRSARRSGSRIGLALPGMTEHHPCIGR